MTAPRGKRSCQAPHASKFGEGGQLAGSGKSGHALFTHRPPQQRHPNPRYGYLAGLGPQCLPTPEPYGPPLESPPGSASCSLRTRHLLRSRRNGPLRRRSARDPVAAKGSPGVSGPAAATSWVKETPPLRAAAVRVEGSWPESRGTPDRSSLPPRSGGPSGPPVGRDPQRTAPANGREGEVGPLRT